jgi:hypothetical protein
VITVPKRPFASDVFTGLMLPDGIFVTMLGTQHINVHLDNTGASTIATPQIYIESVSHPSIAVTPATRVVPELKPGASRVERWQADFTNCPAGTHYVSIVLEDGAGAKSRFIKKIFVTRVSFDSSTRIFRAETPEGVLAASFLDLIGPRGGCGDDGHEACCCCHREKPGAEDTGNEREPADIKQLRRAHSTVTNFASLLAQLGPSFRFCPPGYLPHRMLVTWTPTPPYAGQYSDLPLQDPWWKVLLCILAVILLIAAAVAEAVDGDGSVTVGSGDGDTGGPVEDCCGVRAGGGGNSYVAAGLVAAAAAAATAAGLSDIRDPFRRGQDATPPGAGQLTLAETLAVELGYPEPVALGQPFAVKAAWDYKRLTDGGSFAASGNDTTQNVHVASSYQITAPEVHRRYRRQEWVVQGQFFDGDGNSFRGSQLFVQCLLVGPAGEFRRIVLQDDGNYPDEKPGDGVYSGRYPFLRTDSAGLWRYYVIAQDVNHATPDLKPEEAAQIIGGMVLTHQLVITFDEDDCPFVPDGHVMVI